MHAVGLRYRLVLRAEHVAKADQAASFSRLTNGIGLLSMIAHARGDADLSRLCAEWLEERPFPSAVLILAAEVCADAAAAAAVARLPMPVVAHAGGPVRDGALELWVACDLRIAGTAASFGLSDGYVPQAGLTYRLPRLVGRTAALDLLLVRMAIDPAEAVRVGLATRIADEAAAGDLASRLDELPPIAARFAKDAVLRGSELPLEHALRLETDLYALLQTTADRAEGLSAYRERRMPRFRGE